MGKIEGIPAPAVRRLSLYLRHLEQNEVRRRAKVSSRELSEAVGVTDAQVRKDLAYFGQLGHPGIGYRIDELVGRIRQALGTDQIQKVVLVGAGNLGRALMSYRGFRNKNFELVAVFDNDPEKIGAPARGLACDRILPLDRLGGVVKAHQVKLGIIAVPAAAAQGVADRLADARIGGILNFAPLILQPQPRVTVATVDLAVQLEQLSFQVIVAGAAAGAPKGRRRVRAPRGSNADDVDAGGPPASNGVQQ